MTRAHLISVDTTVPPLSSRLPRAQGGGGIEALSSYIAGHAIERSCSPYALFSKVFIPAGLQLSNRWARVRVGESQLLNGYTDIAATVAAAVESCALISGARAMTLVGLEALCDSRAKHLMHKTRPWCPDCYLEARTQRIQAWDPLYSYLRTTCICMWHKTLLVLTCKRCGGGQRYLPRFPFLDRCEQCGADLAEQRQPMTPKDSLLEKERIWAASAGVDLIEALNRGQDLNVGHFVRNLRLLADQHCCGSVSRLANRIGLAVGSLRNWLVRGESPSWSTLVDLGYRLDIPPTQLGSAVLPLADPGHWRRQPPPNFDRPHARPSADLLERLQIELREGPRLIPGNRSFTVEGLGRVAKRFQTNTSMLKRHFPVEREGYIAGRRQIQLKLNAQRSEARLARLKAAAQAVSAQGLPLTIRNLKQTGLLKVSDFVSTGK